MHTLITHQHMLLLLSSADKDTNAERCLPPSPSAAYVLRLLALPGTARAVSAVTAPHTGQSAPPPLPPSSLASSMDSSSAAAAAALGGGTTLARQSGHVAWSRSHAPTQSAWNRWPQRGRRRAESPSRSSTMHTAHSGAFPFPLPPPSPSPPPPALLEYTYTGSADATSSTGCGPWSLLLRRWWRDAAHAHGEATGSDADDDAPSSSPDDADDGPRRFPEK